MRRILMVILVALTLSGVGTLAAETHPALAGTTPSTKAKDPPAGVVGVTVGKPAGTAAKVCAKYPDKYDWCAAPTAPAPHTILVPIPMTVSCPASTGSGGTAYSSAIGATGGIPPYRSYGASSLPAGLTLNTTTGAISGTPTAGGTTTFTATVTDSAGLTASATCTITITVSPTLSYSYSPQACTQSPVGGASPVGCQVVTITGTGFPAGQPLRVDLTIDSLITELILSPPPPTGPLAVTGPSFTLANIPVAFCGYPPGIHDQFTVSIYAASQPTTPLYTQPVVVPAC